MGRPDPKIWDAVLAHLREHHAEMCRHWFDDIEPLDLDSGTLTLLVREVVQQRYLQRQCVQQFTEAAQAATDRLLAVKFVGEAEPQIDLANGNGAAPGAIKTNGQHHGDVVNHDHDMLLHPDYTFDTFVIGPGNQLAHAAAMAVARKPGRAYNPFFIHAGVGLGKTHLLHAICQEAMRIHRNTRIYYTSCDGFRTQFTEAVQAGVMASFRHRFRNIDVLLIDDIHHLSKRDTSQEEFFHTFNALHQAGKQIVLSSDARPTEIPELEERLVSRFNSGLVAAIDRPSFETRLTIIQAKARMKNLDLPEDVANYVAAKLDTNIRDLEGAITNISGLAHLGKVPITLDLAKQAIGDRTGSGRSQQPTIQDIISAVVDYYDLRVTDLMSKSRQKSIARPRQVGMYLARKYTRYSLEEIGGYFGGRDHTTVMHAIRTIDDRRGDDQNLDVDVNRLEGRLSETPVSSAADNEE